MYQVKTQRRMSGEWTTVWTREPLDTLEKAVAQYSEFNEYSSDWSNVQIIDPNNNVVRDWLEDNQRLFKR